MSDNELRQLEDELGEEITIDDIIADNEDVLKRLKENGDEYYKDPDVIADAIKQFSRQTV